MKYKEAGRKEASSSLYHRLPGTLETQRVKEVTELQSEVRTCHVERGFTLVYLDQSVRI